MSKYNREWKERGIKGNGTQRGNYCSGLVAFGVSVQGSGHLVGVQGFKILFG